MIKLLHGDCLIEMKKILPNSIDMILCDLPYGTTQNAWDSILPLDILWKEYWRVCKRNAAIVLTAQTPFDKILGSSCIKYLRYEWIWNKVHATGHLNAKRQPMKSHENILVFYRHQCKYSPILDPGKPYRMVKNQTNASSNYGKQKPIITISAGGRYPKSIRIFEKDPNSVSKLKYHPTQKPIALFEYMIKTYTNEGDIVLDNCMGSGTTGIAAKNLNRNFIGIEKDKKYYDIAKWRIEA